VSFGPLVRTGCGSPLTASPEALIATRLKLTCAAARSRTWEPCVSRLQRAGLSSRSLRSVLASYLTRGRSSCSGRPALVQRLEAALAPRELNSPPCGNREDTAREDAPADGDRGERTCVTQLEAGKPCHCCRPDHQPHYGADQMRHAAGGYPCSGTRASMATRRPPKTLARPVVQTPLLTREGLLVRGDWALGRIDHECGRIAPDEECPDGLPWFEHTSSRHAGAVVRPQSPSHKSSAVSLTGAGRSSITFCSTRYRKTSSVRVRE